jgi:hypothetical protein
LVFLRNFFFKADLGIRVILFVLPVCGQNCAEGNWTRREKASNQLFWRVFHGTEVEIGIKNKSKASKLPTTMFKNYFKIAWRNLIRKKGFTLINICGLAVGLASSLVAYLTVSLQSYRAALQNPVNSIKAE